VTTAPQSREGERPLKVAWFPYFPVEWLPDPPPELRDLPRQHPATWQRVLWDEFKRDPRLSFDIFVPRGQFPRSFTFSRENTRFHCLRTPPGLRASSLYWLDTLLIRRELRRLQPDLVHGWGTEFGGAAIASRVPYPALVTMQGILTWCAEHFQLNRQMRISRWLEPRTLNRAKFVTCESSFAMQYLAEHYPHLKLIQIEHAPNPLFASVHRAPQTNPPRILCLASFIYGKGADLVLKALDSLLATHNFELIWLGSRDAALETELRAQTSPALWSRVTFRNNVPPEEIAAEFQRATFSILATRADNSPNSVKESVVAGVPVIATNIGGIPDYVFPGRNGLLFENGSVEDLTAKIKEALAHPLFSRGAVDPETLRSTREYLSAKTMAAKFHTAYRTVLPPG
jgi:glycosyltransferase involved in cell wall biosynthesis